MNMKKLILAMVWVAAVVVGMAIMIKGKPEPQPPVKIDVDKIVGDVVEAGGERFGKGFTRGVIESLRADKK